MARLSEADLQFQIDQLKSLVVKADHYYSLDVDGNWYDIKKKLSIRQIFDDKYVFLSDKEWIKKWFRKIVGRGGIRRYEKDDFEENGNLKDKRLEIIETFTFDAVDGGTVVWDFFGYDDAFGALDIQRDTRGADQIRNLLDNTTDASVDINDIYFQLTGGSSI